MPKLVVRNSAILILLFICNPAHSDQLKLLDGLYCTEEYISDLKTSRSPHFASRALSLLAEVSHKEGTMSIVFGGFREGFGGLNFDQNGELIPPNPFGKFVYKNEKIFSIISESGEKEFIWVGNFGDFFRTSTVAGKYVDQKGNYVEFGASGDVVLFGESVQYSVQPDPDYNNFDSIHILKDRKVTTEYGYKYENDRLNIYQVTKPLEYDAELIEPPILILTSIHDQSVSSDYVSRINGKEYNFDKLVDMLYLGESPIELEKEGKETEAYLKSLDSKELKILRNAIFAGKGYRFNTSWISQYFQKKYSDYKPVSKTVSITDWQKRNIEYLSKLEKNARSN